MVTTMTDKSAVNEVVVKRFYINIMNCKEIRNIVNTYTDTKGRDEYNYQIESEAELQKQMPQKKSYVIIGRMGAPR